MTRLTGSTRALVALCGVIACGEPPSGSPAPLAPASRPVAGAGRLRATVDVTAGTLTFEPADASSGASLASGAPNAAVYGNQGVTVRIYNSPVVTSAPAAGKKTYTANVGVRNLLAFRVGDEQGAAAPPDTIGLYVFVNSGPIVSGTSSPCPACTVTVKNPHGSLNFTATNQPYWFWPELLGPANGGRDTTLLRKVWIFEADTQVTRFNFDVLVSAPWVAPNETRFRVDYEGDSLPNTQSEPRWQVNASGTNSAAAAGGALTLTVANGQLGYYRRDSIGTTEDAYVEGRMRWNAAPSATDQLRVGLDDGVKVIALGVFATGVGFVDANGVRIGALTNVTTTTYHAYQLRKYRADSAVIYIDNVRAQTLAYASFSNNPYGATAPLVLFGEADLGGGASASAIDYVVYELGVPFP